MVISTGRQLLDGYLHTIGLNVYLAKNPPQRTLRWVVLRGMILVVGLALFQQQSQGGAGQQQASRHKRPSADAAGFRQVVAGSVGHSNRFCSTACGAGHLLHCAVQVIAIGGLHLDIQVLACGKPCPSQGAISPGLVHRLQVPGRAIILLNALFRLRGDSQCVITFIRHLVSLCLAVQGKVGICQWCIGILSGLGQLRRPTGTNVYALQRIFIGIVVSKAVAQCRAAVNGTI